MSRLKDERGILTLDLMFALVLVTAFTVILFSMMFTLSLTSVAQYISFASARNYSLAHFDPDEQRTRAEATFERLMEEPELAPLMNGSLFRITSFEANDFNDLFEPDGPNARVFHGVRMEILSGMLNFRIPMFGATTTSDRGFRATVNSYLLREPTNQECKEFFANRYEQLARTVTSAPVPTGASFDGVMIDNGC